MSPFEIAVFAAMPFLSLIIGLVLSVLANAYIERAQKKVMLAFLVLVTLLILQNAAEFILENAASLHWALRIFTGVAGYTLRPIIPALFITFIAGGKKSLPAWILVGINAIIFHTAFFSNIAFTYDNNNKFYRGPLGLSCHIISAVLLVYMVWVIIRTYWDNKKEMIHPIASTAMIVIAVLIDTYVPGIEKLPISSLTVMLAVSCVFYYNWFNAQFVRKHEQDLKAEQRIKIMISQIQPHFLYNTLATIRALCRKEPEKAAQVTENFGLYLRQNLDSLNQADLIPVEKEIKHTQVYTDIEMVRFENIRVEYDIRDTAFSVPALCIQPLVENAIRHGVRIKEAGEVRICVFSHNGAHVITIEDNGVGFDTQEDFPDNSEHIGMRNVRERIEKLCGGTVTFESKLNEGTKVTIRIPREEKTA
ncbi:MAG: histidine kinase [Clostridia bacterium]|nr:histidine kinase [Clostridia bacterium]